MYKADFNQLKALLGPVRMHELQPFIDRVLRGKRIHHITGPNPPSHVVELISRWISIGQSIGLQVTWQRLWADKDFEEACDVLAQESLNPQFLWTDSLRQAYQEGFEFAKANSQKPPADVDAIFVHEVSMLPLISERNAARWFYFSHDFLGWAPREFNERFAEDLRHFDAAVYPYASFVLEKKPIAHIWHPTVDLLSPRNQHIEERDMQTLFAQTQLPDSQPYLAYVDRYDRLDHAEILLSYYLKHPVRKELALVIGAEAGITSEDARRRVSALEHMAGNGERIFIRALPQDERILNVVRRRASVQLYWPKAGRTDTSLIEALWAGRPVVAMDQLGVRDIVRSGVTALVAKDTAQLLDQALLVGQDAKLAQGLVERAQMHSADYALLDQELINLACLFLFKTVDPMTLVWSPG